MFIIIFFIILLILNTKKIKKISLKDDATYLFWTGGYDSTFRLCQLLIIYKKKVLPIYLIGDNLDDSDRKNSYKRKNVNKELEAMKIIRKKLYTKYPFTKNLLKPTLILRNVKINSKVKSNMNKLYLKKKISRPVTQYGSMAQVTYDLNKNIEVCSERSSHSVMCKLLYGIEYCSGKVNNKKYLEVVEIFRKFKFPIGSYTKKDMLNESIKYGFIDILNLTWSCWFPNSKSEPCNNCPMCKGRII